MNYIKILTYFFEKASADRGFSPTHISVFMALFQYWNQSRFASSIQISRDEIMHLGKIQSKATYHKAMHYLHDQGYIDYQPSYNPLAGSRIVFFPQRTKPPIKPVQKLTTKPVNEPYNKLYRNPKRITPSIPMDREKKEIQKSARLKNTPLEATVKKEKSSAQKEKGIPPQQHQVEAYFASSGSTAQEAQRFFNHYTANGWLVGGKSPMVDWKASANNWISNSINFNGHGKHQDTSSRAGQLSTRTDKSYIEPL